MGLAEIVDRVKDALSERSAMVAAFDRMLERHAAAAAEDQRLIAAKQAKVDELDKPRRELEEAIREAAGRRHREERERAAAEAELIARPGRDVERYRARVERLYGRLRCPAAGERPEAATEVNSVTGAVRTANVPELQRWLDLGRVLHRQTREIAELWRLTDEGQRTRLAAMRMELNDALEGTPLAAESDA
jgi:hypothetical protein